jgi:hypothetical protein
LDANNVLLAAAEHSMMRTNEMASLLAEKAKISEEEALVLAKRASEAEAEIQRVKLTAYQVGALTPVVHQNTATRPKKPRCKWSGGCAKPSCSSIGGSDQPNRRCAHRSRPHR